MMELLTLSFRSSSRLALTCLTLLPAVCRAQQQPPPPASAVVATDADCFTSSSVVGAVLGTFFATAIVLAVLVFILWWIYYRRLPSSSFNDGGRQTKAAAVAAAASSGAVESGFDNPCFDSDGADAGATKADNAGRNKDGGKSTSWTPLRFFGTRSEKKRSLDDSFVSEPERVSVQLRGHDFTGLGFNVTGNMRDGIYVKDILNRGPASESGKIAQGDKILSVTICFRHVVYEDALTILSYASPYDVTLELEKNPPGRTNTLLKQRKTAGSSVSLMHPSSSVQIGGGISASTSGIGGGAQLGGELTPVNERLVHPLYRSQSIDDLSKVGRADTAIRANVRMPTLSAAVGGGYALQKSKLLTKANLELDAPDVKFKTAKMPSVSAAVSGGASDINISPPDASLAIEPGKASVGSKFSKFGIKVLPDIKFKTQGGAKGSAAIAAASGDVPQLQLSAPKPSEMAINIDMPDGPSMNLPSGDVSVAIDMPEVNVQPLGAGSDVTLDIDAPMMSLSSADVGVNLPQKIELGVDAKMPKTDVSLNLGATKDIKTSSGFHMKFPKFGGGGGKANIKAEMPDAEIGVVAPSVDVNLPDVEAGIELQGPKMKKDSKSGFEFKMPKMNLRKTSKPEGGIDITAGLPFTGIKVPEADVSLEMPKASIEVETPSLSSLPAAVEVEVPSVSVDAKKPKMGFSMPKWSLGGKGGVDVKEPSAELSVEAPSVQIEMPQVTLLSDDDETESGKKKSKFSLKMPKMPKTGVKGDVDVNVALPKVSAEVKVDAENDGAKKKGGKFGLKMPKMPKGEVDVSLDLPKVGGDAAHDVGGVDLDLPTSGGVDVNLELPKISAEVPQGDVDISVKKKGGMFGLKMPKMPKGDVDVSLSLPKVSAEVKHDDDSDDNADPSSSKKKSSKFGLGLKMPKMPKGEVDVDLALPKVSAEVKHDEDSDDGEDAGKKKSSKFGLGFKKPKMPKSEVDVNLDLPKVGGDVDLDVGGVDLHLPTSAGVDVNLDLPKISAEVKHEGNSDSDDADASIKKKSSKFGLGLKMPKMPKGEVDVNLALPKVRAELDHETSEDETDGDGSKKKGKAKFGLTMPKFPKAEMDVNLSLPKIVAEVKHEDNTDSDFGIKLPEGEVDVNLDHPKIRGDVALDVSGADFDLPKPGVDVNLELSKISAEVQQGDADISIKKKGGMFGLKMPKMPKGEIDANLSLPKVSAEVKHDDDSDDGEDSDKKKSSKFGLGLKMPKMPKGEVDVNLDLPKVRAEVKHEVDSDSEAEASGKKAGAKFNLKMPKLSKGDVNLSLPKVSAEIKPDGESDDDADPSNSKKKSSKFGLGLKMPKMPKGELDVDLALPKVSAEVKHDEDSDVGEDGGKKKSTKFGLKNKNLPKGDVDVNLSLPKVSAEVKHDGESGDDEASPKKKSSKFGLKMPKLPKGEVDVNLAIPKVSAEAKHDGHSDDEESSPKKKSSKFALKMPKMSKGEVDVNLALPKVSGEFDVDVDHSDNEGTGKKKSAKFGLKMPKIPKGDVDVNLALPKVSAEVKHDGESDDETSVSGAAKKKSSKFSLKMPKWSVTKPQSELQLEGIEGRIQMGTEISDLAPSAEMRMSDIGSDEDEEGGRKRSKFAIKMPKFGMSKPHVQADVSMPEVSADVELPKVQLESGAETDVKKKGNKFGFKMPKMSASAALPDADLHLDASKDISVEFPKVDMKVTSESSADEEEADSTEKNKKKKRFHLKMPKFGTPKNQVEADLPSLDIGGTASGGASLDVNLPQIKPIDASVEMPKVNFEIGSSGQTKSIVTTDTEDDDHEGAKKKTNKFSLKMPKLGFNKPSADVNLDMDVGGDIDVTANKEDESGDEATKKKIGIKLPKLGWSSGSGKVVQADVDLEGGPSANLDTGVHLDASGMNLPHDIDIDLGFEEKKKGTKFGIKLPGLHLDKPHIDASAEADLSDDEDDTKKKSKLSVKMPKFSLSKPQAELKAGVDLPDVKVEGDLKHPDIDLNVDLSDDEEEESKKNSGKIGFKMPKFHMKKKAPVVDIDIEREASMGLDFEIVTGNTDDDESSGDENNDKRGKFGIKMPKFGFKKPLLDVELPTGKADLSMDGESAAKVQVDIPNVSVESDDRLFSINLPDVSVGKPRFDLNFDTSATVIADLPSIDLKGDIELPSVGVPDLQLSAESEMPKLPSIEVEGVKKKSKFGIDMGKMGFNKPSVDVKVGAGADMPKEVNIELPKVELDFDVDEMEDEKRKGSKFSFKMPKFHMGKQHGEVTLPKIDVPDKLDVQSSSSSLEVDVPKVSLDLHGKEDAADSEDEKKDGSKKKSRFGIKMPKFHMNKPHAPGLGLDVKSEDVAGGLDVKMNLPTLEGNVQGLSSSVEDFEAGSKGGSLDLTLPQVAVAVNPVDLEVNLPDIKSDVLEKEGKKKGKFSFKMPKLHMSGKTGHADMEVPSTEINLNLPKMELDLPETTGLQMSTIDKPSLDLEGGANFSLPSASLQVDASAPQIDVDLPEVELPIIDVKLDTNNEATSKKSPFIVKMPDFDLMKPKVDLEGPKLRLGAERDDSSDSDDERGDKKAFKLGFKMPQFSMGGMGDANLELESPSLAVDVEAPSVEVPTVSASAAFPEVAVVEGKKKSKFGFKMPSMPSGKIQAEAPELDLPTVGVQVQAPEIEKEVTVKMPKFQMRQRGPDVVLPQVELKAEEHFEAEAAGGRELKVEVKKPKFGIKLPTLEFNKPKLEVEGPKKELDVELSTRAVEFNLERPQVELELPQPALNVDAPSIDVQVGNIDVEVARVKAQLEQLQAEFDIQSGKESKIKKPNTSVDSDDDEKSKSSGFNLGLKIPKFSVGREKTDTAEAKVDVDMPSLSVGVKSNGDELVSPSLSSLEAEPVKLDSGVAVEKEKKKFNLGLKMPKFQSKAATVGVEGDTGLNVDPASVESKNFKVNLKAPKVKERKKKNKEGHHSSDHSGDEENGDNDDSKVKELSASASSKLMDVEVKLPRVQVYKNVEYNDAEREHHESSSDEEDEVKDIKKNIGARFGVKLKKPKMFSSSKVDITSKNEPANATTLQPEWKLPRVDLRRPSKSMDQELSVDVDLDIDHHKLEQLSPSERAEAIRRDSKSSTGIRLHSPSYISPRSKKSSLEMLDVESSPRLLSVTRLDPTPPIESSAMTQPMYGNVQLTASLTGPQVSVSDVPSSVLMASDAVKLKRGPPIPARRSIVDANSTLFRVNLPVNTTDVTGDLVSPLMSGEVSITSEVEANLGESIYVRDLQPQQASDTDISVTTSTGSDMIVITCASSSSANAQDAPNRKASSLGDLTRIPTTGSEDGSLERTVSLDFKPVATSAGSSSRAIYNLAVQDLSRVGEDSDEDYSMNRKRSVPNYENLEMDMTLSANMSESPSSPSEGDSNVTVNRPTVAKRTLLAVDTDGDGDVSIRPLDADSAEALWFGSTSIQTVESVQTTMSYGQLEESISTDVTLTTTSLGTSPSETSSSSSDDSPAFPASPEPNTDNSPDLMQPNFQVENGSSQQYHTEMIEITNEELVMTSSTTRTITMEITSPDDPQPQPLTDLNPSAGTFAAVRNRFEQLSGTSGTALNGAETPVVQNRNSSPRLSQGNVVKRLSGNFEDPPSKSYIQPMVPELSEGALSRTVIISSLQLERSEQSNSGPTTSVGPESPVPNLEPPC